MCVRVKCEHSIKQHKPLFQECNPRLLPLRTPLLSRSPAEEDAPVSVCVACVCVCECVCVCVCVCVCGLLHFKF